MYIYRYILCPDSPALKSRAASLTAAQAWLQESPKIACFVGPTVKASRVFRVQGSGLRVQGSGLRVQGFFWHPSSHSNAGFRV